MAGLTAVSVKALAAEGRPGGHADGNNLYLRVTAPGAAKWTLRYMQGGRAREMGLGSLADVSLAHARAAAADARKLLRDGFDPIATRESARALALMAEGRTFQDVATAYVEAHRPGWKNAKHAAQWTSTLESHVFPKIGAMPVSRVDLSAVLSVLEPIWHATPETASRVRGRIEAILDAAAVDGLRTGENPARWKGLLAHKLPARGKIARPVHHAALPWGEVAAFVRALRGRPGMAALALQFVILTAARSGEVRGATWGEVDLDAATWTIPASRMKAAREHRVPLAADAVTLLRFLRLGTPGPDALIFPGIGRSGIPAPLSDMSLTAVVRRLGYGGRITVHGFRSTFRDWAGETTEFPREVIEHALAHGIPNKAEAAYARGTAFNKRRRLMADWAAHCAGEGGAASGAEVVPLRRASA